MPRTGVRLDCPRGWPCQFRCRSCPHCPTLVRPVPPRGHTRWIGGRRWKVPWPRRRSQRRNWKYPLWQNYIRGKMIHCILFWIKKMPCVRVVFRDSTHYNDDVHVYKITKAKFHAVVEHRLIPPSSRSVANDFKINTGTYSVWAPACLDSPVDMLVLGSSVCMELPLLSLHSALLSFRSFSD